SWKTASVHQANGAIGLGSAGLDSRSIFLYWHCRVGGACGSLEDMEPLQSLARTLWNAIEPLHDIVYFAPEPVAAARGVGLRGFGMGYFAGRVAPLGPLPPAPVAAVCYSFAPSLVSRAIPDAWKFASPSDVLATRMASVAVALRAHVAPALHDIFG